MNDDMYKKISMSIDKEFVGVASIIEKIDYKSIDINKIKEIILNKSSKCSDKEKIFYEKLSRELTIENLKDIMKKIDQCLYNKKRKQKESLVKNYEKRVEESKKNDMSDFIITNKVSYNDIKNIMKDYIYVFSKKNRIVYLYLLNNSELEKEKQGIDKVYDDLKNINIELKVIVVDKNSPLDKLSMKEKIEFRDFLKNY